MAHAFATIGAPPEVRQSKTDTAITASTAPTVLASIALPDDKTTIVRADVSARHTGDQAVGSIGVTTKAIAATGSLVAKAAAQLALPQPSAGSFDMTDVMSDAEPAERAESTFTFVAAADVAAGATDFFTVDDDNTAAKQFYLDKDSSFVPGANKVQVVLDGTETAAQVRAWAKTAIDGQALRVTTVAAGDNLDVVHTHAGGLSAPLLSENVDNAGFTISDPSSLNSGKDGSSYTIRDGDSTVVFFLFAPDAAPFTQAGVPVDISAVVTVSDLIDALIAAVNTDGTLHVTVANADPLLTITNENVGTAGNVNLDASQVSVTDTNMIGGTDGDTITVPYINAGAPLTQVFRFRVTTAPWAGAPPAGAMLVLATSTDTAAQAGAVIRAQVTTTLGAFVTVGGATTAVTIASKTKSADGNVAITTTVAGGLTIVGMAGGVSGVQAGQTLILYGVTAEFTEGGDVTVPGRTQIDIAADTTAANVRDKVIARLNAVAAFGVVAASGGAAQVDIERILGGTAGNAAITGTVISSATFTTTDMTGGTARDQTKDAIWSLTAGASMDAGVAVQLGAADAAGTLGAASPLPAATPLAAYMNVSAGAMRAVGVSDSATDRYEWRTTLSYAR